MGIPNKLCDEARAGIVAWYGEGVSSTFLAKVYNVSSSTVTRTLHKRNIKIRDLSDATRRLNIDEKIFDKIDENSAYWLGFLMADGCVTKQGRRSFQIIVGLQKRDKEHLGKFKRFLKSGHKISLRGDSCVFAFNSKRLGKKLIGYGIIPNKTKYGCECSNELKDNKHFWRGVIDGDGCLGIYRKRESLDLCGSFKLLSQFLAHVKTICDTKTNMAKVGNCFRIRFMNKKAKFLVEYFYKDATVYLDRKMQTAQKILNHYREDKRPGRSGRRKKPTEEKISSNN